MHVLKKEDLFGFLKEFDSKTIATLLCQENPQLLSMVLYLVDTKLRAKLIKKIPKDLQTEVMVRISKIESVDDEKAFEIHLLLEAKFKEMKTLSIIKGKNKLVHMLETLDEDSKNTLLKDLAEKDPILAKEFAEHLTSSNRDKSQKPNIKKH